MRKLFKVLTQVDNYLVTVFTLLLISSLSGVAYQFYLRNTEALPRTGGTFHEAMLGRVQYLNPLFSQSNSVDQDLSRLIFSGLTKYDPETKEVKGDLSYKWELADDHLSYTFYLRNDLYWHDGETLDADDVVFTYALISNPRFEGRLKALFGYLKIEKIDARTVKFILKKENSFFPGLLDVGILPKHLLEKVEVEGLRQASFSKHPVGSGPFQFISLDSQSNLDRVELKSFDRYNGAKPYLSKVIISAYENEEDLVSNLGSFEGVRDLSVEVLQDHQEDFNIRKLKLPRYEALIFNLGSEIMANKSLREALRLSLNKDQLIDEADGITVHSPIPFFTNYESVYALEKANELFEKAGYKLGEEDKFRKDENGNLLEFSLVTLDNSQKTVLAEKLQEVWASIGVKVNLIAVDAGTLNMDFIGERNYDSLLIGQNLGSDLDLYSFWHSSQAQRGQNLSQIKSIDIDLLIEKIRKTHDYNEQLNLSRKLVDTILADVPAIFLYTPYYTYAISKDLKSPLIPENLTVPSDRYALLNKWYMKEKRVWR